EELTGIRCPVLALRGLDDEYGTLEQIRGIARRVVQSEIVELPDCGHSPHRDRPRELIRIASRFVQDTIRATTANEAGFSANY
ncbi:MAG: alpha/beta hydrolase, partial [Gammaproteobacteria bacterium]|nr:alpha/beta hydrolase [Gammaproteobacteria bacterium]